MISTLQMHVQRNLELDGETKFKLDKRLATLDSVKTALNQIK